MPNKERACGCPECEGDDMPDAYLPWDNEPKLQPGRPYDGAIVKDGKLIIPN